MANTYDLIIDNKTIVVTPLSVQYLADFGISYTLVLGSNNETFSITEDDYNAIKALDYSQGGGGGQGGIQSNTINNMEFDGDKTLTINGTPFEGGGGSSMVYNTTTHVMSGAKDQDGNDVDISLTTITITI